MKIRRIDGRVEDNDALTPTCFPHLHQRRRWNQTHLVPARGSGLARHLAELHSVLAGTWEYRYYRVSHCELTPRACPRHPPKAAILASPGIRFKTFVEGACRLNPIHLSLTNRQEIPTRPKKVIGRKLFGWRLSILFTNHFG